MWVEKFSKVTGRTSVLSYEMILFYWILTKSNKTKSSVNESEKTEKHEQLALVFAFKKLDSF